MSPVKKTVEEDNIAVMEMKSVPILSVVPYDKNPRVGDIDEIAKSLQVNKMYKPIIVNKRDNQILAGNHTYLAARKLGWKNILVAYVDVSEDEAKRIVLADNRTSDLGAYDMDALRELLASLPDATVGTGYNDEELAELLDEIEEDSDDIEETLADAEDHARINARLNPTDGGTLGEDDEPSGEDVMDLHRPGIKLDDKGPLEQASEKLGGVVQMQPAMLTSRFDGVGAWGIPRLRDDMLLTFDDIPENLDSWAGSATKDWPHDDQWWLYNYGIDSTAGMHDVSKVIVAFYTNDEYFEKWWMQPEKQIPRLLNSKIDKMVTPNFSMDTNFPPVDWLFNLYRSRWVGRYAQEAGIKVVPDITWPDGENDWLIEHVLGTLPTNIPLISIQLQTIDWDQVTGGREHFLNALRSIFDVLNPQGVLLYAGPQGRDIIPEFLPKGLPCKVVRTRMEKLSVAAKMRQRKTTI